MVPRVLINLTTALMVIPITSGFTTTGNAYQRNHVRIPTLMSSDFASAMPETVSPYERIGIDEDQLALGVKAEEVADFIGTKEALIERTMKDIPSFNRAQADAEVDKFFLDSEAVNVMIKFYKMRAENPDFKVPEAQEEDGIFSFRTVVILYLGYVAYSSGPILIRKFVAAQEAAGNWHGTNIPFIDNWLANTPVAVETAQTVVDTVQSAASIVN